MRYTTFNLGDRRKFSAMKVPRQCPFVLVNVGSREGNDEKWSKGKKLSRVLLHSIGVLNFDIRGRHW
jgi:hypothetical protein